MVIVPPYLVKGDTIGMICPAGYMAFDKIEPCINILHSWGFKVKIGKTLGGESVNFFSASDEERLEDFQDMLDDPQVRAILCARGGYGIGRIIEKIKFKKFKKEPKWIIGFSDVTILHAHIYSNYNIATIHGPMAGAFKDGEDEYTHSLDLAITGQKMSHTVGSHPLNRPGKATGEIVGGNLSLLAHICGTSSDFKTKNRILFLEDVGEYLYNVDRMLYQLKRNGKFEKLAGLIIGGFTQNKDTERPFGKSIEEILSGIFNEYDYPIAFGFPISHEKENYAVKMGMEYTLSITAKRVTLKEE